MAPRPPATQALQSINRGVVSCPAAAQRPCDVEALSVKVEFKEPIEGATASRDVVRELKVDAVKRSPPKNYPELSSAVNRRLALYDLVIEAFAGIPKAREVDTTGKTPTGAVKDLASGDGTRATKDKAKITATAKFGGLQCELHQHGVLQMRPLHKDDQATPEMTSVRINQADHSLPPQEFAAVRLPLLDDIWSDLRDLPPELEKFPPDTHLFHLLRLLLEAMKPKEIELLAQACGVRAAGSPNTEFKGLVRIFRTDSWAIGVKIPPLGEFKHEREHHSEPVTGAKESTVSTEGRFAHRGGSQSTTTRRTPDGVLVRESEKTKTVGNEGSSFEQKITDYGANKKIETESKYTDRAGSKMKGYIKDGQVYGGKPTRKLIEERMEQTSGFDVTIARNGEELAIKETYNKIKEGVTEFAESLAKVQELFRKAPQIGWKFTAEVSAMAGTVVVELSPRTEPVTADGRYYPINYRLQGRIAMELVNLKLEVSFGLDAQVWESGLVIKIAGSVSMKVEISAQLDLDLLINPRKEIRLVAESTNELKVTGYVSLAGETVAGGELSVANGFEFEDGKLIVDVIKPSFDLRGTLRAKDVTLSGWIKVPYWWDKRLDNLKLRDGCVIRKFT